VSDVVKAMMTVMDQGWEGFEVYNAATADHLSVTEIADIAVERMGLTGVRYEYEGGERGWRGDIPVVRLRSDRLRARGWRCRHSSREAIRDSIDANIAETAGAVVCGLAG
jgi:UDP-glucose 4-epimerase